MPPARRHDRSGFAVFSLGDAGEAHVMAHRMLDEGRHELGHRLLGRWLSLHSGSGSDWTHLQWHMAVFEIAVGNWEVARARFEAEILPIAAGSFDALTDAPALLWRLWLSAPRRATLAWKPVAETARRALADQRDPYVELHSLLALAGVGDVETIDKWFSSQSLGRVRESQLLMQMATGLRALAAGHLEHAAQLLAATASSMTELGGSHAQNELFPELADYCQAQSTRAAA
jgi:hypothetical protein